MSAGEHALMKNSADEDSTLAGLIEDYVLTLLDAAKARVNGVACSSKIRHLRDAIEANHESVQIKISLIFAPHVSGIVGYFGEIEFGQA
jgi:hypothetical protein